jgi:hypothetical protein
VPGSNAGRSNFPSEDIMFHYYFTVDDYGNLVRTGTMPYGYGPF